jgi:diketogulonate reductase-like aldo/keto reductase
MENLLTNQIHSINNRAVLNNGTKMPWLGLGVFMSRDGGEVETAVRWALEAGYRSIDTASVYGNERGVGKAVRESGVTREDLFVTTKVWNTDLRAGRTLQAFDESLERLHMDYVDLYLIHWPVSEGFIQPWKDLETIYHTGRARAIGVSNFLIHHLKALLKKAGIVPAVNQIEFHPYLQQPDLIRFCRTHQIQVEAWSPLMLGQVFSIDELNLLAEKYHKNAIQIVLRWNLQRDIVTIPKSSKQAHIQQNADLFDFELNAEEMEMMNALDRDERIGAHPDHIPF